MRNMSVWQWPYRARYYIRRPWKWFAQLGHNIKQAHMRVKYGFCDFDAYDLGYWFLDLMPSILKYFADYCNSYPSNERFPTLDSWRDYLISIVNLLENAREEVRDKKNEYYPQYNALLNERKNCIQHEKDANGNFVTKISPPNDIILKYLNRDRQLTEEQDVMIEEALKLLAEAPLRTIWW